LAKKALMSLSQVVIDPEGNEWSHAAPCPLTKKETIKPTWRRLKLP